MKRRLKKNQVVVTALAVMVAVAGYLNYSGMEFGKETAALGKGQEETAEAGTVNTSLIDIPSLDEDVSSVEETGEISVASDGAGAENGAGGRKHGYAGRSRTYQCNCREHLCCGSKAYKENRSEPKNKETLLERHQQRQHFHGSEAVCGRQYECHGGCGRKKRLLQNSFWIPRVFWMQWSVFLTGTADVVINQAEISEAERAQIEDIVEA